MNTNTTKTSDGEARGQSEQCIKPQRKWNLFIGDEPYGFVHATSEQEALDRVSAFKRPFRAVLAEGQQ